MLIVRGRGRGRGRGKLVGSKGVYENWVAVGRKIRPQI
jgi:hypothetical protein